MIKYDSLKKTILSNSEVKKEYEGFALEYEIAHALISARTQANMTQEAVAKKMNTTQSAVARLESGKHSPSLQTIHKYAAAINMTINLQVQP